VLSNKPKTIIVCCPYGPKRGGGSKRSSLSKIWRPFSM